MKNLIMTFALTLAIAFVSVDSYYGFGSIDGLEADCNKPQTLQMPVFQPPITRFRTDKLTYQECVSYANRAANTCTPVLSLEDCTEDEIPSRVKPIDKTYLDVGCSWKGRSALAKITKQVAFVSPSRALTMRLREKNDMDDPLHSGVVDPIRSQIVDLAVSCATQITTSKLYDIGVLSSLFRLQMLWCRSLIITKIDFTRIPNVRMISFKASTVSQMEPHTFTYLIDLESLLLEEDIQFQLLAKERKDPVAHILTDEDVENVRRLHCDCAFAWLRNMFREKPYLITGKETGELATVGNYTTPFVSSFEVMNVDCVGPLNYNNTRAGGEFSYNTNCYDVTC